MSSSVKKKIIAVTGSRSEYDLVYSVFRALNSDPEFDLRLVVFGAHLSEEYGYTIKTIRNDGFRVEREIHNLLNTGKSIGKAKGAGILLSELSEVLNDVSPDYVMVAGDREETVVSGIACTYLEIPLIHIFGGDRSYPGESAGDVDEPIRHAATKLASIHFTACEAHAERLRRLGEEPFRICNSGNPALDRFKEVPEISRDELFEYFGIENTEKPVVLVIQHVISSEAAEGSGQISVTLRALKEVGANVIVNYPNSDSGSPDIIKTIEELSSEYGYFVTRYIPRLQFVNLLRNIDCLVGNSSMALLEGGFLRIPSVNVGNRQKERSHGGNVVFVPHQEQIIADTVNRIINDPVYRKELKNCKKIYGNGNAAGKILGFIKNINKTKKQLIAKDITY